MKRLADSIVIARLPEAAYALLSDVANYRLCFVGITRWEPVEGEELGVGTHIKVLMRSESIQAGGVIRITAIEANRLIAWESVRGIRQRGRWTIEPCPEGTRLSIEIAYRLGGGVAGKLTEAISGRTVSRYMHATLLAVRRMLENEIISGPLGQAET